jgi:dTDP-4-amino-4,6-dideoxygalactose transaminase
MRVKNGKRDELQKWLKERDIPSMVYYPVALHKQKAFSKWMTDDISLPNSERLTEEVLALPVHTEMAPEQLNHIAEGILSFFKK